MHKNQTMDLIRNGATGHFAMVNGRQKLSDLQQNPPNLNNGGSHVTDQHFGGNQLANQNIGAKSEDNLLQTKSRKNQNGGKICIIIFN